MGNKSTVMCDTMIWYDVNQGIEILDKSKYQYYGSMSNIADYLSSDKMNLEDAVREKLKTAIRTMEEYADEIIMVDPTSAGSSEWFRIPIDEKEIEEIRGIYRELLKYANGEVITIIGPTIDGLIESKEKFRLGCINVKQQFEDLFNSNQYTEEEKHEIILGNTLKWLSTEWNRMRGTNFSNEDLVNWEAIEVFVKSYAEFIKTVNVNQPPNKNSMVDLLQLLYVRKEGSSLIWTKESKLLSKIKAAFPESDWKNIIYQENVKHNS